MREKGQKLESELSWVVQAASAFSLGTLAALLYSVKAVVPSIRFQLSWATLVAFVLAGLASVAFWHVIFKLSATEDAGAGKGTGKRLGASKLGMYLLATALAVGLVFAFIYPLKDFSHDKMTEIGFGALIAVGFLSVLGLLFWKVTQYLEADGSNQS